MKAMKISEKKTKYWIGTFCLVFFLSFWSGLRGFDGFDTQVYLLFYQVLIDEEFVGIQSCQSFEPIFCFASLAVGYALRCNILVHYFWVFLYFLLTLKAFTLLYGVVSPGYKFNSTAIIFFIFVTINYVDPKSIFFLTRQYVASAFLMLGFAKIVAGKNSSISFIVAILIHFGALPIALIAYIFTRRSEINWRYVVIVASLIFILANELNNEIISIYFDSLKYKLDLYQDINDGDVTLIQQLKLILYWGLAAWFFLRNNQGLFFAVLFIYIFYILTSFNDLAHLRYYKYLEAMSWPGSLLFIYIFRKHVPYLIVAAASLRIINYLTLYFF
jgi:hypothetical protein